MNKTLKLFMASLLLISCALDESILMDDIGIANTQKNIDILTQDIDETTQGNDVLKTTIYNKEEKSVKNDDNIGNSGPDTKEDSKEKEISNNKPKPKDNEKSTSKELEKSKEIPPDKITYGDIEYVDDIIPYKKLEDKQDPNKDKGSSGVLTQGQDGLQRKEVRKVYVNGKYSNTETVKKTYVVKEPVHAQDWTGTKVAVQKPEDTMIIDNETWYLYKTFSTDTLCIQNINALQEENFREWDGGSMCWGEHLYYSTGN